MYRYVVAGLMTFMLAATAHASENWPAWRGPTGMGQSDEKNLPLAWGGKTRRTSSGRRPSSRPTK